MFLGLYTKKEYQQVQANLKKVQDNLLTSIKEADSLHKQLQTCVESKSQAPEEAQTPAPEIESNSQTIDAIVKSMGYESLDTYGCKRGDRSFDNSEIFQKIFDSMQPGEQKNIYPEPGEYEFAKSLVMDNKTINLLGYGSPLAQNATRFYFAAGIPGIYIKRTEYTGMGEPIIENISIRARGKSAVDYPAGSGSNGVPVSGILVFQRALIRNCEVYQFASHGITVYGNTNGQKFDANVTKVQNCRSASNGGNGLWVIGPDSNACQFEKINAVDNDGLGIGDSSFLGNLHLGHDTNNNKKGGYGTENVTNASTFYGCYEEVNQPLSRFARPFELTVFGGSIRKA
jgi:hypothetical protein